MKADNKAVEIEIEIETELLETVKVLAQGQGLTAEKLISKIIGQFITKNLL